MHSNVAIKNVSWPHFSWATLYVRVKPADIYTLIDADELSVTSGELEITLDELVTEMFASLW